MLRFKQFIETYPNGYKGNKKSDKPKPRLPKNLLEAKSTCMISKWDLMKWIAEDKGETLEVKLNNDGSVTFQFIEVEIEFD
jgi:hypothetical protein